MESNNGKSQEVILQEKINELQEIIKQGQDINSKLATCVQIFAQVHLSKREKIKIANEINNALTESAVEKIFEFYKLKYNLGDVVPEMEEYVFSEAFISNISKYYKSFRGYNPLEEIEGLVAPVEQFIVIHKQLQENVDQTRKEFLMKTMSDLVESASDSIVEIRKIASENK